MALFQAKQDLVMQEQFLFSDPEYNTYSCPWHQHRQNKSVIFVGLTQCAFHGPTNNFWIWA